jgi:hypothetical protein
VAPNTDKARRLLEDDQQILGVDLLAGASQDLLHHPVALGAHRGFHFHRFQRQQRLIVPVLGNGFIGE